MSSALFSVPANPTVQLAVTAKAADSSPAARVILSRKLEHAPKLTQRADLRRQPWGKYRYFLLDSVFRPLARTHRASAPQGPVRPTTSEAPGILLHVLLALVVILVVARILGAMFRRINQPQVMGEVVAGILLGPSFLGWLAPGLAFQLLPVNIAPDLALIAQIGVVLYMFLVGLDLDTDSPAKANPSFHCHLSRQHRRPLFAWSCILTLDISSVFHRCSPFTIFALFIGVAMSITAFPVLARILTDRGMQKTRLGVLALACAAIDDVTAWCLLAFVISVAHAQTGSILFTLISTLGFIFFVLLIAKRCALVARAPTDCQRPNNSGHVCNSLCCLTPVGIGDRTNRNSRDFRGFSSRSRDSSRVRVSA